MQEHGVLERILLIYDEGARRIEASEALKILRSIRCAIVHQQRAPTDKRNWTSASE